MSMKEAIVSVFSNYATFSGRARRSEYWYFVLFNFLVAAALGILASVAGDGMLGGLFRGLSGLYSLGTIVPGLAVCWRRMHDIGKSGAFTLLGLIPLVGMILLIVWFCQDSQPGSNEYGANPKENASYYSGR